MMGKVKTTLGVSKMFEKIFAKILSEVATNGFLDTESLFIDGTHIKASANSHKYRNEVIHKEARSYEKELQEEIERDQKVSTTDPDNGWFHKGEHSRSLLMLPIPVVTRIIIFWILK